MSMNCFIDIQEKHSTKRQTFTFYNIIQLKVSIECLESKFAIHMPLVIVPFYFKKIDKGSH